MIETEMIYKDMVKIVINGIYGILYIYNKHFVFYMYYNVYYYQVNIFFFLSDQCSICKPNSCTQLGKTHKRDLVSY